MRKAAGSAGFCFECLLVLYPRRFRDVYGERMRAAFVAEMRGASGRRFGTLRLWSKLGLDTIVSAPMAHLEERRADRTAGRRGGVVTRAGNPTRGNGTPSRNSRLVAGIWRDARYGLRTLRQAPGLSVAAIFMLALGMGATSAVFTLAEALLLRPVPGVADPSLLVRISRVNETTQSGSFAYPDYAYFRDRADTFADIAAYRVQPLFMTADAGADRYQVRGLAVSGNYFDVLGVAAASGRGFLADEDRSTGTDPVAVLSHTFWRQGFSGDPAAVGATLKLNGHVFTVVGIAPEGFRGISTAETPPDLWVPLRMIPVLSPTRAELFERPANGRIRWVQPVGRLAEGVDPAAAESNLVALADELAAEFPRTNEGEGVALTPNVQYSIVVQRQLVSATRMLALVVGAVLAIAAANIAILLLARGSTRRQELDLRMALGASRCHIVRQLLVESLLLALAGGGAGLVLAIWLAGALASLLPFEFWVALTPDATVFLFAFGVSVITALAFGVFPALRLSRAPAASLGSGGRSSRRCGARGVLVVAQVAVSIVLVVAAGLFTRSLRAARAVDLGYQTDHRIAVAVNFENHGYGFDEARVATREILDRLRALPDVEAATTVTLLPFSGDWENCFEATGIAELAGQDEICTGFNRVGPGYFELMGHPVLRGREFGAGDDASAARVLVVNRTAARRIWGTADVLGRTVSFVAEPGSVEPVSWTVIGVVGDATYHELGAEPEPYLYVDGRQYFFPFDNFLVKTRSDSPGLMTSIHEQIHAVDPDLALADTRSLGEIVADQVATYRTAATLVGLFGGLAMVLAVAGLYGVLSYTVAQRTREIGIRVALGATAGGITGRVLRRGLALVLLGLGIGLTVAWFSAELATGYLYAIEPHDPVAFLLAPAALVVAALAASSLPASRAVRVDPVEALRRE